MAKAKKNVEELYKAIFAIRDALQDAQQLAAEAAVMSDAFGGEIARVITAQINTFFIPGISKFIDDEKTPGAMSPLITFLDSVPLAMTRGAPDPQQVTPAPVENPQLATPAEASEPVEGSYAAKTQEARKRENKEDDIYDYLEDIFMQADASSERGQAFIRKAFAEEFPELTPQAIDKYMRIMVATDSCSYDEATNRSTRVQEGFQVVRKGAKDTQVVATFPNKEAANARAASLNETLTDMEKDFLKLEYVVKSAAAPQKKKDVSQAKALPTPKKLPEAAGRASDEKIEAWLETKRPIEDPEDPALVAEFERRFPHNDIQDDYFPIVEQYRESSPRRRRVTESSEDLSNVSDDELRQAYLSMVNSDDAWFSGKDAKAQKYKAELDRRGAELYPNSVKESLSLKDIPIDDYTVDEAYDEMLQGGEVDSEIAPDYIAENMFGAEPGSDRHQQVKDRLSNLQKNRNTVVEESAASGTYEPDFDKLAQQVAALVEDGYTENDALEYIRDTEEVDHNMLYDAYITLKAKY